MLVQFSEGAEMRRGFPLQQPVAKMWDGVPARPAPLSIRTSRAKPREEDGSSSSSSDEEKLATTPTARESMIPDRLPCPPAPRKKRPPLMCGGQVMGGGGGGNREFFRCPPDLEAVFAQQRMQQPAK